MKRFAARVSVVTAVAILAVMPPAWSRTTEIVLGVRESKANSVRENYATSAPQPDFGAGVKTTFDFSPFWYLRQGLMWETRTYDAFLPNEHKPTAQYVDFTNYIGFRFLRNASFFGGPSFKFLVAKECKASGPCNIADDPTTFLVPLVAGADYGMTEQFAFEVFYEITPGEIWTKTFTKGQTAGVNFKYVY